MIRARGRPRKPNQNPVLDFRSVQDDAWYTIENQFMDFPDKDDDEVFHVGDFKTGKELDELFNRFRPACVQLQDKECYDMRRESYVCALREEGEEEQKFYGIHLILYERELHTRKGGEESCSCIYVVGWLEGPGRNCTEQMGLRRICKLQLASPLFDPALASFVKMKRAQLT
ncbi:hypothetical protein MKW92_038430 [Papaver armeniacum]|nr:hypothetical protein MKW92_038430 [Papaver armeniacum]